MARVTITIDDQINNTMKVVLSPSMKEMGDMLNSGKTLSPAQTMAVTIAKNIASESRKHAPIDKLLSGIGLD